MRPPSIRAPLRCRVYPPKTNRTASGRLRPNRRREEIRARCEYVGPLGCEPAATEPALPCACLLAGAAGAFRIAQEVVNSLGNRGCSDLAAEPPIDPVAHHFRQRAASRDNRWQPRIFRLERRDGETLL